MKIKCIANEGKDLTEFTLSKKVAYKTTRFSIKIGETYNVYGMLIWNNCLHYFTTDFYQAQPHWYPAELFEVTDTLLPFEWHFNNNLDNGDAIWGYKELVYDKEHNYNLFEREVKHVNIFIKRKIEIDNFSKQKYILYTE